MSSRAARCNEILMPPLLAMLLTLNVPLVAASADNEASKPPQTVEQLEARLWKAVQDNDLDAFQTCWVSPQRMRAMAAKIEPPNRPSEQQLDQMTAYFQQREAVVQAVFPILRRAIERSAGKLDQVQLQEVRATIRKGKVVAEEFSACDIVVSGGGVQVRWTVDDGGKLDDGWYLFDKPMLSIEIIRGDQREIRGLPDFATPEQRAALEKALERQ